MEVDLELEKAKQKIIDSSAKRVCIQLPDGLKPKAGEITDYLKEHTKADIYIWAASCYGACDVPVELELLDFDLIIQWGHSHFNRRDIN
ncbi:diphthamide synthesis protein [Candidatus Woesearchaeota archaeon]|nr:diphthamide synthesis protein [Candidatus Woesearchaeota archaeon]